MDFMGDMLGSVTSICNFIESMPIWRVELEFKSKYNS